MKKISIISHGLSNGGAERVSSLIANYLNRKDYEVQFIAVYSKEKEYKLDQDVHYEYINSKSNNIILRFIERIFKIRKIIKKYKPDTIISFIHNETILINKKNIIYSLRIDPADLDDKSVKMRKLKKFLRNYCYKKSKAIVFQTNEAKQYFNKKIQKKGYVVMNPVEINNMPKWEDYKHEKVIISACRLSTQKNLPLLIKSFSKISHIYSDYKLDIYGKGPEYDNLMKLIKELEMEDKITLRGYTKDIHQLMAKSSIFILSSDFEGLSNSMLEALVIGIPCICTDCPPGGAKMVIQNGQNGLLVPVNDINAMVKAMEELILNPNLSLKFNKNNKQLRNDLDVNKICSEWETIINN